MYPGLLAEQAEQYGETEEATGRREIGDCPLFPAPHPRDQVQAKWWEGPPGAGRRPSWPRTAT